ncbi:MAG: hypothetical protein IJN53_01950, partial [Oscillospiraceae bacterium]|nr:hypothetical protein [Oscillospiraceae bacterium]
MQKIAKKTLSIFLAALMIVSCLAGIAPTHVHAASFSQVEGWYESIFAQISGVSDSSVTAVSYSGPTSGSLSGEDLEFLVRNTGSGVRIDIPGLKAGTYTLTVTAGGTQYTASNIKVVAYDRSGYAHWNNTEGVGAYNDDGTLKSNAVVLYVTDSNKNSVKLSAGGVTVTGIGNILNTSGQDTGSGKTSKGGKANTNQDVLRRLADEGKPLVIRIVGNVTAPSGLTAYDSVDYGGTVGDNGYMARMRDAKNVTIEGIGNDAVINGWGFHFMCSDAYPNYGKNFEVRNVAFKNVPEDCIGMEGVQSGSTLTASVERCWIHHCSFTGPKISNPAESDKDGGDGACDFKRGQYFTNSYCIYDGYHKTNLVGASDSNVQYHLTYHHNYWKGCESRAPLARQANIHMYNNVFEDQSSYCMSLRADTYIFSESNTFIDSKVTDGKTGGECKSYNNVFQGSCSKQDPITVVTSKSTKVSSNNKYANFDTNSSYGYVASGDYLLESASASYNTVKASAGPMTTGSATTPETGGSSGGSTDTPESTTAPSTTTGGSTGGTEVVPPGTEVIVPAGAYIHNFTENGKDSSFYTISGNTTTSRGDVTYNGMTLSTGLKMESATSISFNAPSNGTLILVFGGSDTASSDQFKLDGTSTSINSSLIYSGSISAGSHTITKDDTCTLYYMAYAPEGGSTGDETHTHSYSSSVTTAATCGQAGVKTYTCSCGDSYTESIPATGNHNYSNGTCTVCGASNGSSGGSQGGTTTGGGTGSITEAGGRLESAYVEWTAVSGASGYNVYVKPIGGSYTQLDTELIRNYGSYWRADALGLKAGSYCMKIVPIISGSPNEGSSMVTTTLSVVAHNRDGYAHKNGAVGAYNNDGTLKSGAIVVYVTNSNKDSVKATIGGTTYTGLQSILYDSRKTSAVICVRIIGELDIPSKNTSGQIQIKENASAITVEGVGEDATCNGWGVTLSSAKNVEVRNLGFMNNASSEGDSVTLQKCTYCWVHNCDFFYGTDRGGDKDKGDGALDTKQSQYITHSYNHFWDCGKCNLQGSNTSDTSDNITYHHNWYDHSDSRHPRVRVATVHVYNNYYDGVAKYGIGNAYKAEVISEGNYFRNTKNPMLTSTQGSDTEETMSGEQPGTLTSYQDYVTGATSWIPNVSGIQGATSWSSSDYDCVIVNTRFNGYSYTLQSATDARANVMEYAGRMNGGDFDFTFTAADDTDFERNSKLDSALKSYSTSLKSVGGNSVSSSTNNDGPASGGSTHTHSYTSKVTTAATCTSAGVKTFTCSCGASYTESIPATGHNYVNGTCSVCGATTGSTHTHSYTSKVTTAATCATAGVRTYTCSCGDSYTEAIPATGNHSYSNGSCTVCGAKDPSYNPGGSVTSGSYIHNFTENGKNSDFYTITGNLTTSRGDVSYNGLTLSQGLKMESSTNISFTAPSNGTLILVFGGSDTASSDQFKLDGTSTSIDSSLIYTGTISAGSHTITKDDTCTLYYIVYAPEGGSSGGGNTHTHSYSSSVTTAATCDKAGVRTYTCSCGDSYTEAIAALGHNYSSKVTAPTCTAQGYTTHTCSTCGNSYVDTYVAATSHSYTSEEVYPNCTTDGYIIYTCGNCGNSYTEAGMASQGHFYENGTCTYCGAKDPNYGPPHTHSYSSKVTAPTCTAQGYTTYTCSCGDSYVGNYVVAKGHSYTSSLKAPTCTATGLRTYTCGNCGYSYTETVAALGHSYSNGACTVCGAADPNYQAPDDNIKNGLAKGDDGNYYYYINNEVQWNYTGLIANSAGNWYILNGQAQLSYDGLITFEGTKYLIKAGHVNTAFTGITKQEGVYYYFNQGVNDLEFEGLVYCNGMKAYVQDGEVNFNKTGIVEDEGKLVYVKYGIWRNTFKGLART